MKKWNSIAAAGMLLPPSLVIAFYMYVGIFNRMLGDDYCTGYMAERLGLLRSIWYWYRAWQGDFSTNVADWLLSLFGTSAFPFYTAILLFIWVGLAVIAVKEILRSKGYLTSNLFPASLLGIFLVFATLIMSPSVSQSVFWWQGARRYLAPLIFVILYFALGYHFTALSLNRVQSVIWLFVSFGLAFFMGGFNETLTPVLVVLLAGMIGFRWLASKYGKDKGLSLLFLCAGFGGALASLIIMVLAPGNSVRQAFFPAPPGPFTIIRITFAGYFTFLQGIFTSPYIFTGSLGTLLGSVWLGMRANDESRNMAPKGWWVFALLVAGFILALGCFPAAVYATSEPPPGRSLMTSAFFLAVAFLASGFVLGEWLAVRIKDRLSLPSALSIIACGLIIFSSWGAFQDLYMMRAEHISFAQNWDRIDAQIKDAKNSDLQEINIPAMNNWAGIEYPTDNPKYWVNICYSKFYGIKVFAPPLQP